MARRLGRWAADGVRILGTVAVRRQDALQVAAREVARGGA